jgi:hypothetical protein
MAVAQYTSVACFGPNTELEVDEYGYRKLIVGAFNLASRNGPIYPITKTVEQIFEDSSSFMRNVRESNCRGELGHPNIQGLSMVQIINRLNFIDPKSVAVHYRAFEKPTEIKDEYGKKIHVVYAWLKPSGPYHDTLERRLNNRAENCAFSVRSLTDEIVENGQRKKLITDIITYDVVEAPGMKCTTKFDTLEAQEHNVIGLEEITTSQVTFTDKELNSAIALANQSKNEGLESEYSRLVRVRDKMGWNQVQVLEPNFLRWNSKR